VIDPGHFYYGPMKRFSILFFVMLSLASCSSAPQITTKESVNRERASTDSYYYDRSNGIAFGLGFRTDYYDSTAAWCALDTSSATLSFCRSIALLRPQDSLGRKSAAALRADCKMFDHMLNIIFLIAQ
jgi:hypothetical protein